MAYNSIPEADPDWVKKGQVCGYGHCMAQQPRHCADDVMLDDGAGCGMFGRKCPGGRAQVEHCAQMGHWMNPETLKRFKALPSYQR